MTTPLELYKEARQILSDPTHWTIGSFARSKTGRDVSPLDPEAVSFCLLGVLAKVNGLNRKYNDTHDLSSYIRSHLPEGANLVCFNDDPLTKHEDVLDLLDRTIAKLEAT